MTVRWTLHCILLDSATPVIYSVTVNDTAHLPWLIAAEVG